MQPLVFLAFCCGVFGVASQSLLLRECIISLPGGEIWISPLLGMWFLAGAVGVFVARRIRVGASRLAGILAVAYIPVFCFQYLASVLLVAAGSIPPAHHILAWSLLIAAPAGLLTGMLLSVLSRRRELDDSSSDAVWGWAAAGGVVGGLAMTLLLYAGTGSILRVDIPLIRAIQEKRWSRLAPSGTLEGSFGTAQAGYLYGTEGDRWVTVRGGAVHEVVGDQTQTGKIAAMALSQNFTAARVLVIGNGLSLCERFLRLPQVKAVDWVDPDPEYVRWMWTHLPEPFRISDPRFHRLTGDARTVLADRPATYDVVVVNMPRVIDGSLHRLLSAEFFERVRQSLRPLGVVVVGIMGDRNIPGGDPAYQGAWVESTLDAVFSQTLLVPDGQRTFFVSAAEAYLQVSPATLETRFGLIENAGEVFPPESLSQVYRPDLVQKMLDSYDAVDIPRERLVNRDNRPSYALCGLLQAAGRSGLRLDKPVRTVLLGGPSILFVPVVLLMLVRLVYVVRTAPRAKGGCVPQYDPALRSDVRFIGGCASAVSVGGLILLMHAWQMRGGWLSLHIGLVFSLVMLGLAAGVTVARWAVSLLHPRIPLHSRSVLTALAAILAIQAIGLAVLGPVVERSAAWPIFIVLLSVHGFLGGATMVLAAKILESCGSDGDSAPARWIGVDHLGATGGCLACVFLVPVMGLETSLYLAAVVAFANVVFAVAARHGLMHPGRRVMAHPLLSPVGYGLFGLAVSILSGSHILAHVERSHTAAQATVAVQDWVQGRKLSARTIVAPETGKQATYQEVREGSQLKGYIFRSEDFSNRVYGYGGPMSVVLFAEPGGALIDFRITRSYETPRYISRIRNWMDSLKGKKVFGPAPMQGVNAVSGATLSCDAILRLLRNSGSRFDASVLAGGQAATATGKDWIRNVDWLVVYWVAGIVAALVVIRHGRLWSRVAMLAFTAAVGGFWLNRQYSTDHVMRLLSGQGWLGSPIANACLLLGIPLVILFLGNIYCGYLCPFGALQELLGFILPRRFKPKPALSTITAARFIKYGVLFAIVTVFFLTGSKRFLDADPLTLAFNRQFWSEGIRSSPGLVTAILVLAGALVVTRMWCRYLCPTGAFLSLFNLAGWLGRFLPAKKFGRCEFGLGGRDHLDCIHCDRCRCESRLIPARNEVTTQTAPKVGSWALLLFVLCLAAWTLAPVFQDAPAATTAQTVGLTGSRQNQTQNPVSVQR